MSGLVVQRHSANDVTPLVDLLTEVGKAIGLILDRLQTAPGRGALLLSEPLGAEEGMVF